MNTFRQDVYPIKTSWGGDEPELYISTFGDFHSSGDFNWEQINSGCCVHAILGGSGVMNANGRRWRVKGGDVFVFHPGDHVKYHDAPETPWRYRWFRLEGARRDWSLSRIGVTRGSPLLDLGEKHVFFRELEQVLSRFRRGDYSPLYPVAAAWRLLECVTTEARSEANRLDWVEECRQIIDHRIGGSPPPIDELADRFRVNRSTLYRVFKKRFGASPKDYIENRRHEMAKRLLELGDLSVKEVAFACGYDDQRYFCRAFRHRAGASPTQWKKFRMTCQKEKPAL